MPEEVEQPRARKPKEVDFKEEARDGDGDGLVQDGTVWERPVEASDPKPEESVPLAEVPPVQASAPEQATTPTSLGGDYVSLSSLHYPSNSRNSRSVALLQKRLIELGHLSAGSDPRGWLRDGTHAAMLEFSKAKKVSSDSPLARESVEALFKGTGVEVVG